MEKVILDFYTDTCPNCRMLEPIFNQLEAEYKDKGIKFKKINANVENALANKYSITAVPTLIFLEDNKVKDKVLGLRPKTQLAKKISEVFGV